MRRKERNVFRLMSIWFELGLKGNSNHVSIREKIFMVGVLVFRPTKGRVQIYYGNI